MSQLAPYLEAGAMMSGGFNPRLHRSLQRRPHTGTIHQPAGQQRQSSYDAADRAAIEQQKYLQQANLIAQRQAAQEARAQGLSQSERMHLMKLQNGLSLIPKLVSDGTLTEAQGNALAFKLHTQIDPFALKQQAASAALKELQLSQAMENATYMQGVNKARSGLLGQMDADGTIPDVNHPGKRVQVTFDDKGKPTLHTKTGAEPKEKNPGQLLKESHDEEKASRPETIAQSDADLSKNKEFGQRVFDRHQEKLAAKGDTEAMTGPLGGALAGFLKTYGLNQPNQPSQPVGEQTGLGGDFSSPAAATPAAVPSGPVPAGSPVTFQQAKEAAKAFKAPEQPKETPQEAPPSMDFPWLGS